MSQTQPKGYGGNPGGRFFGGLLMAVGALIILLCGLCSGIMLTMMIQSPGDASAFGFGLLVVGVVGGVPILVGLVLFFVGRGLYRASKARPILDTFS